jgi:biopolymer transport protein ExbD
MRLPRTEPKRQREPIGPLVDVVFLLLVFFLLAGTLEPVKTIEVDPPQSEHASSPESDRVRVLVDAKGRIGVEGQVVDAEALSQAIALGMDGDTPRAVQIEADANAATGSVLALLKRLRSLGVEELELVTRPRQAASDE